MAGRVEGERDEVMELGLAGLKRASCELRAMALAVLVAENSLVEVAYPAAAPLALCAELQRSLHGRSGPIFGGDPLTELLASTVAPGAGSFLLFPWSSRRGAVIVAFGFTERHPPHSSVPPHVAENINLAALAAWSAKEIARLRAELRAVNCQFAGRKLVERAKGILQTQHGMNEQQAYEYLRKMSRQRRIAMAKLAEDLVAARCP
jgi:hypothetical protein